MEQLSTPKHKASRLARWKTWCLVRSGRVLRGLGGGTRRHGLTLQHFGIDDISLNQLQPAMQRLSEDLGMTVRLAPYEGEAVIVDEYLQRSVTPQLLQALCEERPVVVLCRDLANAGELRGRIAYGRLREQVQSLLQGVTSGAPSVLAAAVAAGEAISAAAATQAVPPAGTESGFGSRGESRFDSRFDTRYPAQSPTMTVHDEAGTRMLQALRQGKVRREAMPVVASYGEGAMMVIDFMRGRVLLEPAALDALRLAQQLPALAPGATPLTGMQEREFDLVLWDIGRAAHQHTLIDAPDDWWHAPLQAEDARRVSRHSLAPLDLELARVLARGRVTPSQLRRECRAGVDELRAFLQAALLVGLVSWAESALAEGGTAAASG